MFPLLRVIISAQAFSRLLCGVSEHAESHPERGERGANESHRLRRRLWVRCGAGFASQRCVPVDPDTPPPVQVPQRRLHDQPGGGRPAAGAVPAVESLLLCHRT